MINRDDKRLMKAAATIKPIAARTASMRGALAIGSPVAGQVVSFSMGPDIAALAIRNLS